MSGGGEVLAEALAKAGAPPVLAATESWPPNVVLALVYFLRKVLWTVPGFNVEAYRPRLRAMHEHIGRSGSFVSHAERFLIEARKPR